MAGDWRDSLSRLGRRRDVHVLQVARQTGEIAVHLGELECLAIGVPGRRMSLLRVLFVGSQ